jgi:hypothetical protein
MSLRILTALALTACLSSCTTWNWLTEGEDQEIIIKTDPPLADCTLTRYGTPIAHLYPTPGAVYIPKTADDILITCTKPGYVMAEGVNESDLNGAFLVHLMFVPMIAIPIELSTHSVVKYDSPFKLTLPKPEEAQ